LLKVSSWGPPLIPSIHARLLLFHLHSLLVGHKKRKARALFRSVVDVRLKYDESQQAKQYNNATPQILHELIDWPNLSASLQPQEETTISLFSLFPLFLLFLLDLV